MDPIANMLTQIRNSSLVGQKACLVRYSKIKEEIINILKESGYIKDYKIEEKNDKKNIRVSILYENDGSPRIRSIKRISKSGRRIYSSKEKMPIILKGLGILIISTSKGLMTDKKARRENLGGEIICEIW